LKLFFICSSVLFYNYHCNIINLGLHITVKRYNVTGFVLQYHLGALQCNWFCSAISFGSITMWQVLFCNIIWKHYNVIGFVLQYHSEALQCDRFCSAISFGSITMWLVLFCNIIGEYYNVIGLALQCH